MYICFLFFFVFPMSRQSIFFFNSNVFVGNIIYLPGGNSLSVGSNPWNNNTHGLLRICPFPSNLTSMCCTYYLCFSAQTNQLLYSLLLLLSRILFVDCHASLRVVTFSPPFQPLLRRPSVPAVHANEAEC